MSRERWVETCHWCAEEGSVEYADWRVWDCDCEEKSSGCPYGGNGCETSFTYGACNQHKHHLDNLAPVAYCPDLWINVYLEDQSYGGPEEGGWWYTTLDPIESRRVYCRSDEPNSVRMKEAQVQAGPVNLYYDEANQDRPDISSVLSRGQYRVQIEAQRARAYPDHRPIYE